jgi:hypothetical protein
VCAAEVPALEPHGDSVVACHMIAQVERVGTW